MSAILGNCCSSRCLNCRMSTTERLERLYVKCVVNMSGTVRPWPEHTASISSLFGLCMLEYSVRVEFSSIRISSTRDVRTRAASSSSGVHDTRVWSALSKSIGEYLTLHAAHLPARPAVCPDVRTYLRTLTAWLRSAAGAAAAAASVAAAAAAVILTSYSLSRHRSLPRSGRSLARSLGTRSDSPPASHHVHLLSALPLTLINLNSSVLNRSVNDVDSHIDYSMPL